MYAAGFSFAYISLETGAGALILFGVVQLTMIISEVFKGRRPSSMEWAGMITAFVGLAYLVWPTVSQPSFIGFLLMSLSGIAWASYTLIGKALANSTHDKSVLNSIKITHGQFFRTLPFVLLLLAATFYQLSISTTGVILAITAGGVTSAIGYAIWYMALQGLSPLSAASLQLLVPMIAALGGVVFADEPLTTHLMVASVFILCGIFAVFYAKNTR
ncbi:hypothetical protein GCM10007877_22530 [Marinibactrum halimedae]|uniref:EamA domain-containing protein n=1 Tax=Marinibactrum halimedae TaxID=1444977 RepID=A0AA37T818_9GAMM|nr:hypothetical protein GCM10007877_22530 [Marinibactrum halimedae]